MKSQETECQEYLDKVEKMLQKDGRGISHERFVEGVDEAFNPQGVTDQDDVVKPGWVSLLPAYYYFEWVVTSLKNRFAGTSDNDDQKQNDEITTTGESSIVTDTPQEAA